MGVRVFISHQHADSDLAGKIAAYFRAKHDIDAYLDLLDPVASKTGDELGEHLRLQLGACTQLMAVVSMNTKSSWWVPWEIGVATEKDYPIATFAGGKCDLPSYLRKWPYLQTEQDLDVYARESKKAAAELSKRRTHFNESVSRARASVTPNLHDALRRALGQQGYG